MATTYADLVDHVLTYAGGNADRTTNAQYRRSVQAALTVLAGQRQWAYYWTLGRITTNAPYATGTVAYTQATRTVTLTGGVWPTWAADGFVVIADVMYRVERRVSDTALILAAGSNPGSDVAGGEGFRVHLDTYPLPADFVRGDEVLVNEAGQVLDYTHPRDWAGQRNAAGPGAPWMYTYVGDPNRVGRMMIALSPAPDAGYAIDFLYHRSPRALVYDQVADGTVSATGTAVTGSQTRFTARMAGSIIRFSDGAVDLPTGPTGNAPAVEERVVVSVEGPQALTLDTPLSDALAGVKYVLSDPIDFDPGVMQEYLLREVEAQFRVLARLQPIKDGSERAAYDLALTRALENDQKHTGRLAVLRGQARRSGFLTNTIDMGT